MSPSTAAGSRARVSVISAVLPDPAGIAPCRVLDALGSGLVELGVDLDVTSWDWRVRPDLPLPGWCRHTPLPGEARLPMKVKALARPRGDVLRLGWEPRDGAFAVADDIESWHAVEVAKKAASRIATLHYLPTIDAAAIGRGLGTLQWWRSERRIASNADRVIAYSRRVGDGVETPTRRSTFVPIAYRPPTDAIEAVAEPVVGLIANWAWAPNRAALAALLKAWPTVRAMVPTARLRIAGRGETSVGTLTGVEVVGEVADSTEFLSTLAVQAFPCPDTSGPKIKSLESLALGLPLVTTVAGAEGLDVEASSMWLAPYEPRAFGEAVAAALIDPEGRALRAAHGRQQVAARHAPLPAARAWLRAVTGADR